MSYNFVDYNLKKVLSLDYNFKEVLAMAYNFKEVPAMDYNLKKMELLFLLRGEAPVPIPGTSIKSNPIMYR